MAAKATYKYAVQGGAKAQVIDFLEELQALPQHKWIPIEEMSETNRATCTPRQVGWMEGQVEKRVAGRTIEFTVIEQPAEASA